MTRHIKFIFLASFFFSVHMALLAYVNSSMLGEFASQNLVSITYAVASILSVILVTIAPRIIRIVGNMKYILVALLSSSLLLYFISKSYNNDLVLLFIVYFSLNSVILYGLDLFLEHYSVDSKTGNIRGLYLTFGNIGWVIAPVISGTLQTKFGFPIIYLFASISVIITFFIIFFSQKGFVDKIYKKSNPIDALYVMRKNKDIRIIISLNFILQFFYVIMVVYSPIYLTSIIGFSWKSLGILLSIMLLPFIIFPYPSGRIDDKYLGEKELLFGSMIVAGLATICFAKIENNSFLTYAIILFITRIGASVMETMSDSAFFKHVTDADSSIISLYRNMSPVAYIIAPLIGATIFNLTSYQTLFYSLGGLMIIGSLYTLRLKDTQ